MDETRRRIAAAAVELHTTVGPARTTISAIAGRAGVERLTVYRHFPDERSLFRACVQHGLSLWPIPDPARWRRIADPFARLEVGLAELYSYYRGSEEAWTHILPDLPKLPALMEANAPVFARFAEMRQVLSSGWRPRRGERPSLQAILGLALDFQTWRVLVRESRLSQEGAIRLMAHLVRCIASA